MTNIECLGNPDRVPNFSNYLKAVNMDCYITVPLRNPVARLQWQPFLIDVSINLGDVMSRKNFLPYGVIFRKIAKRFSNLNGSFPISGHTVGMGSGPSLVLPFPIGPYQVSGVVVDRNATASEYVGTVKIFLQAMEPEKSKKRLTSKKQ
ncbi:GL16242 [Drosophila persimilis]|uniref:GL16242 n=1 Tax=Drosophila persimilis TaxID=7234 RepID=B4HBE7_DROPE|nr:uncharacterized protein LOC6603161 [Drosophila persimilis]EDW38689.1 GL16242 [Drosophila persimilis]